MGHFRLVNLTFKLYPLENNLKIKVQFESSAPLKKLVNPGVGFNKVRFLHHFLSCSSEVLSLILGESIDIQFLACLNYMFKRI